MNGTHKKQASARDYTPDTVGLYIPETEEQKAEREKKEAAEVKRLRALPKEELTWIEESYLEIYGGDE